MSRTGKKIIKYGMLASLTLPIGASIIMTILGVYAGNPFTIATGIFLLATTLYLTWKTVRNLDKEINQHRGDDTPESEKAVEDELHV